MLPSGIEGDAQTDAFNWPPKLLQHFYLNQTGHAFNMSQQIVQQ